MSGHSRPTLESELAALHSVASLATDFILTAEAWPLFVAWAVAQGELPETIIADRDGIEHLAGHLRELAGQACARAGIT